MARGGGALLAGIGGIVLLGDDLNGWSVAAIVAVATGMALLAVGAAAAQVALALVVAVTIGTYTVVDSHAARDVAGNVYTFAVFLAGRTCVTVYGLVVGRGREMASAFASQWRRFVVTAAMSMLTYGLVLAAVRRGSVGHVAALRESSVLVVAFIGWRYLSEGAVRRRTIAAAIILGGLVLLVISG